MMQRAAQFTTGVCGPCLTSLEPECHLHRNGHFVAVVIMPLPRHLTPLTPVLPLERVAL